MGGGPTALPASPRVAPKEMKSVKRAHVENSKSQGIFVEIFAGKGVLTKSVAELGMKVEEPNDFQNGGTDFRKGKQVEQLKERLCQLAGQSNHLMLHLAPPCATFSRARDRSRRTRLRSNLCPEGLASKTDETKEANQVARRAYQLAVWAADELGAMVSMENPRRSYLWNFLDRFKVSESEWRDVWIFPSRIW